MRAARAPIIAAGTLAGGTVSQDRYLLGDDWAIVLDGASNPHARQRDGGWYADTLGRNLDICLRASHDVDLRDALSLAIASVAEQWSLVPGSAPSSTVVVVRWNTPRVEALVLGDSAVVARTGNGIDRVCDDCLADIGIAERRAYRDALRRGDGYTEQHRERLKQLVAVEQAHRNREGGYWIAEATPAAAQQAIYTSWPVADLRAVLLATDGVTRGVDYYGTPGSWADAIRVATEYGPEALVQMVHGAEASDPNGQRWPRSKPHDDKTAVLLTWTPS